MARRYFGTDGVRGVVGEILTPELVERLGRAASLWTRRREGLRRPRHARRRASELEEAFARGVVSAGGDCILGGVLPTPAVALLALDLGVVISASHNPPEYNGVKFFDSRAASSPTRPRSRSRRCSPRAPGDDQGTIERVESRPTRYLEHIARPLRRRSVRPADRRRLRERRVLRPRPAGVRAAAAQRCTRSATSPTARTSTSAAAPPTSALLQRTVVERRLRPRHRVRRRRRPHARGRRERASWSTATRSSRSSRSISSVDLVAVTVMTNLGFHALMQRARHPRASRPTSATATCSRRSSARAALLGGEQSGHVIYLRDHVTGDGLAAGLLLCARAAGPPAERGRGRDAALPTGARRTSASTRRS